MLGMINEHEGVSGINKGESRGSSLARKGTGVGSEEDDHVGTLYFQYFGFYSERDGRSAVSSLPFH